MKIKTLLVGLAIPALGFAQNYDMTYPDNAPAPCHPVPSDRQIMWNETEFYAFFHYGMNTFTGLEWGFGNEAESRYAPKGKPNPEQWVTSVKAAGMNGGIAVVKHHDGFCLWPTATTTHSIANAGNEIYQKARKNAETYQKEILQAFNFLIENVDSVKEEAEKLAYMKDADFENYIKANNKSVLDRVDKETTSAGLKAGYTYTLEELLNMLLIVHL